MIMSLKTRKEKLLSTIKIAPFFFIVFLLPLLVHAEVETFTNSLELNNSPVYRVNHFTQYFDYQNNYIEAGKPLELVAVYSCEDVDIWNSKYPQYAISNVVLRINITHVFKEKGQLATITTDQESIDLLSYNTPFQSRKKFVQLYDSDTVQFNLDTTFSNQTISDSPCTFFVQYPTWKCNACDDYQFAKIDLEVEQANLIDDDRRAVFGYLSTLIDINFEILSILFWIILIAGVLGFVGILVYFIYLGYNMLKELLQ